MSNTVITTGKVRLSYPHLFVPAEPKGGGDKKYSASIIIPKKDKETLKKIKAAVEAAKEEGKSKWGGKIPAKLHMPLRDGDEDKPEDEAYANSYFFSCSSTRQPGVVDRSLQPILDPEEVYPGCYVRVNVNFFAYDSNGNKGIGVGLNHVQKLSDGERLGGASVSVDAAFADDYEDDDEDEFDFD